MDTPPVSFQYPLVSISIFYPPSAKECGSFTDTNPLYLSTFIRVGWWGGGVHQEVHRSPSVLCWTENGIAGVLCVYGGRGKDNSDDSENGKSLQ